MPNLPSIGNPEPLLHQALTEMQDHLRAVRPRVAAAMADERRLGQRLEAEAADSRAWEARAMRALRAGDEGLARAALVRKAESDRRVAQWRAQHEDQRRAVQHLRSSLRQLQEKVENARRSKDLLVAKARRAMAQQQIQATLQGLHGLSAFEVLAGVEEQVDRIEAEAQAQMELAAEMGGQEDRLLARFAELEEKSGLEDQLAALKARMTLPVDDELAALKSRLGVERAMPVSRLR